MGGGTYSGVWGTFVLRPQPPAVFCDFEANLKHFEAPFNGRENIKLASNIEYTDSGICAGFGKGGKLKGSIGDGSTQCGPGSEAPAGGLGDAQN